MANWDDIDPDLPETEAEIHYMQDLELSNLRAMVTMNNNHLNEPNAPNPIDIIPYVNTGTSFVSDSECHHINLQQKLIERLL